MRVLPRAAATAQHAPSTSGRHPEAAAARPRGAFWGRCAGAGGGARAPLAAARRRGRPAAAARRAAVLAAEIAEVAELLGIRAAPPRAADAGAPEATAASPPRPAVEYLVRWRDGSPDSWEPASNLADDLLRDYEQRWWGAARKGDADAMAKMLAGGAAVLARSVDENRRSALHFAAALNRAELVRALLDAGAEVDLADRDGYTPLHMAAGYLHTGTVKALLDAGADPEQADRKGRSPLELVESLRASLPASSPGAVPRRVALEEVLAVLTDNLFEDAEPAAVLASRAKAAGDADDDAARAAPAAEGELEYLVRFADDPEPVWVPARHVSAEVAADFEAGLEYADADAVLDVRVRGDARAYLVRWGDGYPDSWEPEEHVAPDLVAAFEAGRRGGGGGAAAGGGGGGGGAAAGGGGGGGGAAAAAAGGGAGGAAAALQAA